MNLIRGTVAARMAKLRDRRYWPFLGLAIGLALLGRLLAGVPVLEPVERANDRLIEALGAINPFILSFEEPLPTLDLERLYRCDRLPFWRRDLDPDCRVPVFAPSDPLEGLKWYGGLVWKKFSRAYAKAWHEAWDFGWPRRLVFVGTGLLSLVVLLAAGGPAGLLAAPLALPILIPIVATLILGLLLALTLLFKGVLAILIAGSTALGALWWLFARFKEADEYQAAGGHLADWWKARARRRAAPPDGLP